MTDPKYTRPSLDVLAAGARLAIAPGPEHDRVVAEAVEKRVPGVDKVKLVRQGAKSGSVVTNMNHLLTKSNRVAIDEDMSDNGPATNSGRNTRLPDLAPNADGQGKKGGGDGKNDCV